MSDNPLSSLAAYSEFIGKLFDRPDLLHSNVTVWSDSPCTGIAEGEVLFRNGLRLRMREELDFDARLISSYGYEVYRGDERLYWYDDFPHPKDQTLASSFPHHQHVQPDIKHHRIPAPEMGFHRPNLTIILERILHSG